MKANSKYTSNTYWGDQGDLWNVRVRVARGWQGEAGKEGGAGAGEGVVVMGAEK